MKQISRSSRLWSQRFWCNWLTSEIPVVSKGQWKSRRIPSETPSAWQALTDGSQKVKNWKAQVTTTPNHEKPQALMEPPTLLEDFFSGRDYYGLSVPSVFLVQSWNRWFVTIFGTKKDMENWFFKIWTDMLWCPGWIPWSCYFAWPRNSSFYPPLFLDCGTIKSSSTYLWLLYCTKNVFFPFFLGRQNISLFLIRPFTIFSSISPLDSPATGVSFGRPTSSTQGSI